jgi:hypothetical protein
MHGRTLIAALALLPSLAAAQTEAPVVVVQPPSWRARIGLGLRAGDLVQGDSGSAYTVGGELLFRLSRHFSAEVAAEYQRGDGGGATRTDVPATAGLRLYLGNPDWVLCPFVVASGGVDFARREVGTDDARTLYIEGQAGGGVELRLGAHVALDVDVRADFRTLASSEARDLKMPDGAAPLFAEGWGVQFRGAAAVYF